MVAGSRSSLRRPKQEGNPTEPSTKPSARDSSKPRDESLKRLRIPSTHDQQQIKKRRKLISDVKASQLRIPLRGRKLVSPRNVTHTLPDQSQSSTPLQSPKTQYDQIRKIEKDARVAIRGGARLFVDDRRHLRSQDGGSRSKSELAQYFPNYEQMLILEAPPPDPLNPNTRITIVDDTPGFRPKSPDQSNPTALDPFGVNKPLHNARRVDLLKQSTGARRQLGDPLSPEHFIKVHKKEERREKQIRNNEKEKAQHEKYQLERLMAELRGPDWLRTMGISGITDTEKKKYEPKRIQFIQEIRGMIEKYEAWKVKEKRQRLRELELAAAEENEECEDEDEDEDEDEHDADDEQEESDEDPDSDEEDSSRPTTSTGISPKSSPSSFDIDALAARQLLQEAQHSSSPRPRKRKTLQSLQTQLIPSPSLPPPTPTYHRPFTSFYSKRHMRDAALGSHGRRSRGVTAFGVPVPEVEEREFALPESYLTDEAIRASQRRRRRKARNSLIDQD